MPLNTSMMMLADLFDMPLNTSMMMLADLSGRIPAQSLMSVWTARTMRPMFLQAVAGRASADINDPDLAFFPPPGASIRSALCVGLPSQALETHARSLVRAGVNVDILVLGITPAMRYAVMDLDDTVYRYVYAYPETAAYLRGCGRTILLLDYPWRRGLRPMTEPTASRFVASTVPGGRVGLDGDLYDFITREIEWKDSSNRVPTPEDIVSQMSDMGIYVAEEHMLDDPIRVLGQANGTLPIALRGSSGPARAIHAAKHLSLNSLEILSYGQPPPEGTPAEERLGVVVPFGGLEVEPLMRVLARACGYLPADVPIVLSHQNSSTQPNGALSWKEEENQVQAELGYLSRKVIYTSSNFGGEFNLPIARNNGEMALPESVTHVLFLDADVMIEGRSMSAPGFYDELINNIRDTPDKILVPYLVSSEGVGVAPGLATYPREAFTAARGFDFAYRKLGYEDIDLISALRARGVEARVIGTPANHVLTHIDHQDRWADGSGENLQYFLEKADKLGWL